MKRVYRDEDPTNPPQSRVVHVRNLSPTVIEADLIDALSNFGNILYIAIMNKQMALVEFEDLESARQCVKVAQDNPLEVAGVVALFNYSTSQSIQRGSLESEKPNHVLALTISNPNYPINARVLYRACSQAGKILRIAVMRRALTQALIEFVDVQTAIEAKKALNGADIYPNCCTLKVEYAKAETVNVTKNTLDHWDYTSEPEGPPISMRSDDSPVLIEKDEVNFPNINQQLVQAQQQALMDAQQDYYQNPQPEDSYGYFSGAGRYEENSMGPHGYIDRRQMKMPRGKYPAPNFDESQMIVLMIYGIDQINFDCHRMYNLLCCYGNVVKIKFLQSKPDTAMVQMANRREANNVMQYLNGVSVFGTRLSISLSKQSILHNNSEAFTMPNGTSSFSDFTNSRNHRFSTLASAQRNRIVFPTEQLHFFNLPLSYEVDQIQQLFENSGLNGPMPIQIVPFYVKMAHSLSGLVTFESPEKALEALMIYNHMEIVNRQEDDPPILKLTLSSSSKDEGQY